MVAYVVSQDESIRPGGEYPNQRPLFPVARAHPSFHHAGRGNRPSPHMGAQSKGKKAFVTVTGTSMTHSIHDITSLIDGLHSTDAASRSHARHQLVAIGRGNISALVKLLGSPVQHVRWEAAKVLEGIGDPAAVPA